MRHAIAGNKLGRNSSWRKATVRDIAKATLKRQRICTTKAKAKEARKLVDRLITLGKKGTLAHKRRAFVTLCEHRLVSELFNKIVPRFKERSGGYTRIIPLSYRRGDNAQLVYLELTEKEEVLVSKAKSSAVAKKTKDVKLPSGTDSKQVNVEQEEKKSSEAKVPKEASPTKITSSMKDIAKKERGKFSKNMMGGIRRMFRRKTSE